MLSSNKSEVKNDSNILAEELKGSVWAGEFRYTTGAYQCLQPFSIVLNDDGTLTWTDIQNTRAGGTWGLEGNKINIKFPNGTSTSADLFKDRWGNFSTPPENGFQIANVSASAIPTQALLNDSQWKGSVTLTADGHTEAVRLEFVSDNSMKVIIGSLPPIIHSYAIDGGGISIDSNGYFILSNNATEMKGYDYNDFALAWKFTRQ